jgi:23S rRNA pseudouridine1911/1915/1917 synthase
MDDAPDCRRPRATPEDAGVRLDRFLAGALADLSRSRIKRLIQDNHVASGGATITDPSYRVKPDQRFEVTIPASRDLPLIPQSMDLTVVHEDADLLVIDKPAGLVVHPGPGRPDATLVNALLAHCGDSLSGIGGVKRPGIVHRLDKDTSGLIVVAKNDRAHQVLARQFAERSIDRTYCAVVWGLPMPPAGEIEGNIGRHPHHRKKMAVVAEGRGKPALTRYATERGFGTHAAVIRCKLATGRTHQIRVHLAHIGHPLIGDPVYGRAGGARIRGLGPAAAAAAGAFSRQALHAVVIGFEHPVTGERLKFSSPLPHDMQRLLDALEVN